jgi:hypothetical protein
MDIVATERSQSVAESPVVPFILPKLDEDLTAFFCAEITWGRLGTWRDRDLHLLNLMGDPWTRTTKTLASLVMVARAVHHIRRTGERILMVTPTSGNKGTGIRAAIARAYQSGIVDPRDLRSVVVVPKQSLPKLRASPVLDDPVHRSANPVAAAAVAQPSGVKQLCADAVLAHRHDLLASTGFRVWNSLDLDNYRVGDAVRAFAEAEFCPINEDSAPRVHAHAVSSAYGLLGYHLGHRVLTTGTCPGLSRPATHPGFFLVQQLATPDMVLSLVRGGPSAAHLPNYTWDPATDLWRQEQDPVFPSVTEDVGEQIDATFYTSKPPTSSQINEIVADHGGGGVIVSRAECLSYYHTIRDLLEPLSVRLPADSSEVREWSLIMAITGVLIGIERDLIKAGTDVVVHGSGFYTDALLAPAQPEWVAAVRTPMDVAALLSSAATA